jgi:ribosome-associated protein
VAVLDVRGISPVTDFLVLATGSSARQMRSVTDEIQEMGQPRNFKPLSRHDVGDEGDAAWVLCDFVDVVVHVFSPTARSYYDLDGFWGDSPRVDWQRADQSLVPTRR